MNRLLMYLGHRYVAGMIGLYAVWTPVSLLDWNVSTWLALTCTVPFVMFMLLLFWGDTRHDHRLCLRCADGMPLDGNDAAAKRDRTLRAYHSGKVLLGMAVVFLLSLAGAWLLEHLAGLTSRQSYVPQMFGILCPGILLPHLRRVHTELYPWCPYCDHGRGRGGGWFNAPVDDDGPKVKEPA
jgi:hypothetical protein